MAFGLGALRLSPAAFWSMTPREIAVVAEQASDTTRPPGREGLAALMRRFPD